MRLHNPFHSIRRYALINILTSGVEQIAKDLRNKLSLVAGKVIASVKGASTVQLS